MMSADIANKLSYLYPNSDLIVAFIKGARVNLSIRGEGVREVSLEVMKEFPHALSVSIIHWEQRLF